MAREVVSKAEKLPGSKIDWEKEQAASTMISTELHRVPFNTDVCP